MHPLPLLLPLRLDNLLEPHHLGAPLFFSRRDKKLRGRRSRRSRRRPRAQTLSLGFPAAAAAP